MASLRNELRASLLEMRPQIRASERGFEAAFLLPASFTGFQGHFRGQPICPGVCLIQTQIILAECVLAHALTLREVITAKFLIPITPEKRVEAAGWIETRDGIHILRSTLDLGPQRAAEFVIRLLDASPGEQP
jgi:3-hydroxymyristoyl/3-hydroxydecanoyl-(acyl carrier protein) dehydratase